MAKIPDVPSDINSQCSCMKRKNMKKKKNYESEKKRREVKSPKQGFCLGWRSKDLFNQRRGKLEKGCIRRELRHCYLCNCFKLVLKEAVS